MLAQNPDKLPDGPKSGHWFSAFFFMTHSQAWCKFGRQKMEYESIRLNSYVIKGVIANFNGMMVEWVPNSKQGSIRPILNFDNSREDQKLL